ncbi:MAG TPA: anhydro-N-acetylmuramic acid kinase, partial [Campylobacterales bacterium]|nr:anhydro-N-acetylmuramic acid kinase [Campylobacterales bacterium]
DININPTSHYGIHGDDIEAMIFAWLAHKRWHNETVTLKSVTGATKNTILGGIYAAG